MELSITGNTRLAAFFADPAKHSLSPKMHSLSFQLLNIDAVYLAFEIKSQQLEPAIEAIRTLDMLGVNLSMPHKKKVLKYLDELTESCQLIGACNTIVNHKGHLVGYNTDGIGFIRSLKEADVSYQKETFTFIGAGGAATAMICQAAIDGVKKIHIFGRMGPGFQEMLAKKSAIEAATACQINLELLSDQDKLEKAIAESSLLVNATSVGMQSESCPLSDLSLLRSDLTVYDVIYQPRETLLLKTAKKKGAKTINGLAMLLYQGAAAFELWTQKEMPIKKIRPVIERS